MPTIATQRQPVRSRCGLAFVGKGAAISGATRLPASTQQHPRCGQDYSYAQQVGANEIAVYVYNYVETIAYYYEPIYATFYQTSGSSISFDGLRIDVSGTVSAVPLPHGACRAASPAGPQGGP